MQKIQAIVILHNIRSAHNVGSIFRTADAAGVLKMYLTGHTATPTDRFGRVQKDIAKVALGAEKSIPYEHYEHIEKCLEDVRKGGYRIVALEQDAQSVPHTDIEKSEKMAFVFGNEPDGLERDVLEQCDTIAEIPMHGEKESLNVSVAAGIALYGILHS